MKKIIHVSRPRLAKNLKQETQEPPIIVITGGKRSYGNRVTIDGPATIVYNEKPLSCGARVWIETTSDVVIT